MANIMINENCNQRCPYCFASEFVNVKKNNISFADFIKATEFILTEKEEKRNGHIGIIGGEPLLHPEFDRFVSYLVKRSSIKNIVIYTNGVYLKEHIEHILDKKVGLLINVNSVEDVGLENYKKTEESIGLLVNKYKKQNRLTIGLNIYNNKDYSFFINMAEKYNLSKVRLSIVVPAFDKEKSGLAHFTNLKERVLEITKSLLSKDISFRFDCNLPVPCMWSPEQVVGLKLMGLCSYSRDLIPLGYNRCLPIIDILPDLTAIRCFGLSNVEKVDINNFDTITDLRNYFVNNIDLALSQIPLSDKCRDCSLFPRKCYGGCLANRQCNNLKNKIA